MSMCTTALEADLERLALCLETHTGLAFPPRKWRELRSALRLMAEEAGFEDIAACAAWLQAAPWDKHKAALCARHLVICETYFFREPRAFQLACEYARDKLARPGADRQVRIWSAGCCTGEEAYSIAISLLAALPDVASDTVRILATDIDAGNLRIAAQGIYRQWSFRNTSEVMQRRYFAQAGERLWRVDDAARKMVRFAELNLAQPAYPDESTGTRALDMIFCRNVLMYFSRRQARQVIARFRECLVDGGWLCVSPSEATPSLFEGFEAVSYPDAVYFRKIAQAPSARPPHPLRSLPRTCASPVPAPASLPLPPSLDPGQHHASALAAIAAGDPGAALESLKRLAYLEPDCVPAQYLMGVALAAGGRRREALRHLRAAAEMLARLDDRAVVARSDGMPAAVLAQAVQAQIASLSHEA